MASSPCGTRSVHPAVDRVMERRELGVIVLLWSCLKDGGSQER